jgi:hypothetical protein
MDDARQMSARKLSFQIGASLDDTTNDEIM